MTDSMERYERNMRLFGADGQKKLLAASVTVIGAGGLGSPLIQHLALLGVGRITAVDPEDLDESNRNRFVGARATDPSLGMAKVEIVARMVREINPDVRFVPIKAGLVSEVGFEAVKSADWVIGCLDSDGPRAVLNELCQAYRRPYFDLASDVPEPGIYGGRVMVSINGDGCLSCLKLLDPADLAAYFAGADERARRAAIYGVEIGMLAEKGPSVSPVNGVVAALAATEFMVAATGMRAPTRLIDFRGDRSRVTARADGPQSDCPCCHGMYGEGAKADVEHYLKVPHLQAM